MKTHLRFLIIIVLLGSLAAGCAQPPAAPTAAPAATEAPVVTEAPAPTEAPARNRSAG